MRLEKRGFGSYDVLTDIDSDWPSSVRMHYASPIGGYFEDSADLGLLDLIALTLKEQICKT